MMDYRMIVMTLLCIGGLVAVVQAAEPVSPDPDKLGRPTCRLAPWTYSWCADRPVQEKPESCFIPRRLERMDKVYRTALTALGTSADSFRKRVDRALETLPDCFTETGVVLSVTGLGCRLAAHAIKAGPAEDHETTSKISAIWTSMVLNVTERINR